jgi:hypothetical protein
MHFEAIFRLEGLVLSKNAVSAYENAGEEYSPPASL